MASRAEEHQAEEQRRNRADKTRTGRSKPGVPHAKRTKAKKHAQRKATYAIEEGGGRRPSRKSTRKSANRSKPDAALIIREGLVKGSPQSRHRKAMAKSKR